MSGNHAELLVDGHEVLPRLLADIAKAERTVHAAMFLWFFDPVGEEVAGALIARARAGVKVRVLLNVEKTALGDPFSTGEKEMMKHDPSVKHDATDVKPLVERMRAAGIEVVDSNIDYAHVPERIPPRLSSIAAQISSTIDLDALHVDHRKLVVIDGAVGYCGGANIGAQYMYHVPFDPEKDAHEEGSERRAAGLPEPWWKWHDSLTRFEGPVVRELEHRFHERFVLDGGEAFTVGDEPFTRAAERGFPIAGAELFCNEPDDKPNAVRELYVRLIGQAERSIFFENPYLYHPAIVGALLEAKRRRPELRVTLMLPARQWNDNKFAHDAQQHEYEGYLACGIEVYEYQRHFNHLKMAVFDERWSIHGSTNGNYRSLEDDKDFELVVLVDDEPMACDILRRVRDVDVTRAKRFGEADLEGGFAGFRVRHRDPRTLLLVSRKEL
jgi:cardiolipin synthase